MVGLAATPGRHILEERLLAKIEFYDLGHVTVDRLVVGDAGADGIGERDGAGLISRHQAGYAQRAVGPEDQRIEEVVVDAAIDHVDALEPFGRAHIHDVALDDEVAALDQFDAELVGQKRVLVIGRVVDAGRQQHDRRLGGRGRRCDRFQRRQQLVRIILDRRHAIAREQLGKKPQHDLAVLQHVGNAGRRAGVVLEHVEIVGVDAHDIDAGDMHVDVVRHFLSVHLRAENRILKHQVFRNDAGLENFAAAINVLDVGVDGFDALLQAPLQNLPFGGREDARDDVERDQALLRVGVAIHRKGNADAAEEVFGFTAAEIEDVGRHFTQPTRELGIGRPDRVFAARHLVEHIGPRPTQARARNPSRINGDSSSVAIFAPTRASGGRGGAARRLGIVIAHVLGDLAIATAVLTECR